MITVLELQSTGTSMSVLHTEYSDINVAYNKYYTILAAAAMSKVPIHTAMIVLEDGSVVRSETFQHEAEPAGEA